MSRQITISVSDAEADGLAEAAKANGLKFFTYCRQKLLADMTPATPNDELYGRSLVMDATAKLREENRFNRLENSVADLRDLMHRVLEQGAPASSQVIDQEPTEPIDLDDVVNASLQTAETAGLTQVEDPMPQMMETGARPLGQRMVSRLHGGIPRHLSGHFPR